jgi:hypothetical protein
MNWHEIDLIVARMLLYSTDIACSKYILPKISRVFYEAWQINNHNPKQLISLTNPPSEFLISSNTLLTFRKSKITSKQIKRNTNTRHLKIRFVSRNALDSALISFRNKLISLSLSWCNTINNEDVRYIANNMSCLRKMELCDCENITDISMLYVVKNDKADTLISQSLTSLCLANSCITGRYIPELSGCVNLKSLTTFIDIFLAERQGGFNYSTNWHLNLKLEKLNIISKPQENVLNYLPELLSVKHVTLTGVGSSLIYARIRKVFPNIISIKLGSSMRNCDDIFAALNYIRSCPHIIRINLDISIFDYGCVEYFFATFYNRLTHINIISHSRNITNNAIKQLYAASNILCIKLDGMFCVPPKSMIHLTDCPNITNMKLHYYNKLRDIDLQHLIKLKHLQKIDFGFAPLLTNCCAKYLLQCSNLIKLKFKQCVAIDDLIAVQLSKHKKLLKIKFIDCPSISRKIISMLLFNITVVIVKDY